jgi:hypothetical protein
VGSLSQREIHDAKHTVEVLASRNIDFIQKHDLEGHSHLFLDPPIETLLKFSSNVDSAILKRSRQTLSHETIRYIRTELQRFLINRRKGGDGQGTKREMDMVTAHTTTIIQSSAPGDDQFTKDLIDTIDRAPPKLARLKYNQGFSSAVRRPVCVMEFI